jgi:hypothetical protein
MTRSIDIKSDYFARALTAIAVLGPVLLLFVAASQPLGARGEVVVLGDGLIACGLLAVLTLRTAYGLGYSRARALSQGLHQVALMD